MKITKSALMRIIQEETVAILEQGQSVQPPAADRSLPQDYSPGEEQTAERGAAPALDWEDTGGKVTWATLKDKHAANNRALKRAVRDWIKNPENPNPGTPAKSYRDLPRDHPARVAYRKSYRAVRKAKTLSRAKKGHEQAKRGGGSSPQPKNLPPGEHAETMALRSGMTAAAAEKKAKEAAREALKKPDKSQERKDLLNKARRLKALAQQTRKRETEQTTKAKREKGPEGRAERAATRKSDAGHAQWQRWQEAKKIAEVGILPDDSTFRSVAHARRVYRQLDKKLNPQ